MKIRLYFDEDSMRHALVQAIRARGVDVITALDAGMIERADEEHLDYATAQGRVLYSLVVPLDEQHLPETLIHTYGGHPMTEKALLKRIVVDPKIMLGKPVIRGTRLTVEIIVEKIAYGATFEDIRKDYPFITTDDVRAALLYAARSVAHEEIHAA